MVALTDRKRSETYKDLLQVSNVNVGIDATLRDVEDGEGTASQLQLSTAAVNIKSGFQLAGVGVQSGAFFKHEVGGLEFDASAIADGGLIVGTAAGVMALRAAALTAGAAGFLKHELGGLEFDLSAVGDGQVPIGTGAGTMGLESGATLRTSLGVAIGSDVQAWAAVLDATTASFLSADRTKLDGIETAATADQTDAEIKTAYENNADTNEFSDAEQTKLVGIETAATADQTNAEIKTAYEANADTNEFSDAEQTKLAGVETAATADQSNAEIKTAYEANADTNEYDDAEQTKLAGIETAADVTDDANVRAALAAATANISVNSRKITTMLDPTADQDAATKKYVDDQGGGAGLPAPDFTSAEQTITQNAELAVAHGLGVLPNLFTLVLRCKTANKGYEVGDEVLLTSGSSTNALGVNADTTNVVISTDGGLTIINEGGSTFSNITLSSWKWVVRTWK